MNRDATLLADALWEPESTAALDADGWTALLTMARAELLIGTLAVRLRHLPVPDGVRAILDEALIQAEYQRRSALWEADSAALILLSRELSPTSPAPAAFMPARTRHS